MSINETNGWSAYEKLVLEKLDDLDSRVGALDEKVTLVRIDVAGLKIKAGIWGAGFGMIPAIVTAIAVLVAGS